MIILRKKWQDNYSDLRTDTLYQKITAHMCLDHTTGFPNWRFDNKDSKLHTAFMPGSRYSYSGQGMVYLQTVQATNTASVYCSVGPMAKRDNNANDGIELSYGLGWAC